MKLTICVMAALAAITPALNAALVQNGSFETPALPPGGSQSVAVSPGGSELTGWTVTGANAWVLSEDYSDLFTYAPQDGRNSLDLKDAGTNRAGIKQTVGTVAGLTYELSYWVGDKYDLTWFSQDSIVDLYLDNALVQTATVSTNTSATVWTQFKYTFVATGATEFWFQAATNSADYYTGLDNVTLTQVGGSAVPEPSTIGLSGLGLVAAALWRRKR